MTRIFVTSIIWTLCLVSQSDAVHSLTATTSSSTAAAAAGAAVTSIRAAAATSTASAVWTVGVLRSGKESSHRIYSQGEMADDEKVDPTKIRVLDIVVYTFLFAIGAPANYKIIKCLIWTSNSVKLYRKSRHHFLLLNLAIADAIVLFIVLPTEVLWRVTASWRAGNIGCKLFQFFRVFGLYASSMILICISLDRYYAVVQPFKYGSAANRISRLLKASWILSAIFSAPQLYFFRLQNHPRNVDFNQCVTFDIVDLRLEKLYAISNVTVLYGLPLLVILICYIQICIKSFSRKNCKPGSKRSAVASTNEPLGASSIIVAIREDEEEEEDDDDEEEEEEEDEEEQEKRVHRDTNKGSEHDTVDEREIVKRSSVEESNDLQVAAKVRKGERKEGSKKSSSNERRSEQEHLRDEEDDQVKDDLSISSSGEVVSESHLERKKHGKGQCILMATLSADKSFNQNNNSVNKGVKVSSSGPSASKSAPVKREYIEEDKISEALVSGKCSNCDGGNYSTSIITGTVAHKSRYKKQSEVRKSILRQTLIIILAFIVCWTPYTTVVIWYQCDRDGYKKSGHQLLEMFWLFAVSNSAVNPFIYGKFVKSKRQK